MRYLTGWLAAILLTSTLTVRPAAADALAYVAISNVSDTHFVVSWSTADPQVGQVQLVGGETHDDVRGADFSGRTHYVSVTGLQANSQYAFDIAGGNTRYDNAGAHWVVDTGATLPPRPPDLIFGLVRNPDGSNAADTIVFATIDRLQQGAPSAALSALVTAEDDGIFSINLAETRALSNPTRYFDYAVGSDRYMNNSVTFEAVSASGTGLVTLDLADARLRVSDLEPALAVPLSTEEASTR